MGEYLIENKWYLHGYASMSVLGGALACLYWKKLPAGLPDHIYWCWRSQSYLRVALVLIWYNINSGARSNGRQLA